MMLHRKNYHKELVRKCDKLSQNRCTFQAQYCWFIDEDMEVEQNTKDNENTMEAEVEEIKSVFRNVKEDLKPPLKMKMSK